MAEDKHLLGYLGEYVSPGGSFYGGLLVTNERGLPREFRHTDATRPSKLQVTLYGDQLHSCLGSDAMAPALYNSLTEKPGVLQVDRMGKRFFGEFVGQISPAALLIAAPSDEGLFAESVSPLGDLVDFVRLDHLRVPNSFVFAYLVDDVGGNGRRILETAQRQMNLYSPFDRIRTVLRQIAEMDEVRPRG